MDQLWVSDGTVTGTQMVVDLTSGSPNTTGATPSMLTVFNGRLYFRATDNVNGHQIWSTDGTALGTQMLKVINGPTGCDPDHLTVFGNSMYFVANNGSQGAELWVTDGTEAGTHIVKDIAPGPNTGSAPHLLTPYHNKLYFVANDGNTGNQLWVTDGTEAGTHILQPSNMGIAQYLTNTNSMAVYNDRLYFNAHYDNKGEELWAFDDTPSSVNEFYKEPPTITVYPNPVADILNVSISATSSEKYELEVFNVYGQKVLRVGECTGHFTLNTEKLAPGIYYISIANNGLYSSGRFVKE